MTASGRFPPIGVDLQLIIDVCPNADVRKLASVAERVLLDQALTPGREDGPPSLACKTWLSL